MSDVVAAPEPAAPQKQDPEGFALRARPRPVIRFKRGLIIGLSGLVAAGVIAVTWVALEPPSFQLATGQESGEPDRVPTPDMLDGAPASYGDVPRLGPPLPGDLGRPILARQRELEADRQPPADMLSDARRQEAERRRAAADAERQRRLAAEEAARSSAVLVQLAGRSEAGISATVPPNPPLPVPLSERPAAAVLPTGRGGAEPAGHTGAAEAGALRSASSAWTLTAGTVIPVSLITGLNSDLPGTVLAQVTEPVRDSATGRTILIPQGARLIGSYDSKVAFGQRRLLLVWQRILFPDGSSVALDDVPATDLAGYSGIEDEVDFHSWRLIKGIALSTLLGVGTELSLGSSEGELVRAVRESMQQNAARAGDQITRRNLDVQPTLTVRPGFLLRALIHKDLVLRPWIG